MDRYEHLPIYKYDLTIYFEKIVRNFTRYHKYTLGSELGKRAGELSGLFLMANSTVEKPPGRKTGTSNPFPKRKVASPLPLLE